VRIKRVVAIVSALVGMTNLGLRPSPLMAQRGVSRGDGCAPAAFLVFEQGVLAGVDWVDGGNGHIHTRAVITQSMVVDATIDVRADQTAAHSSVVLTMAGDSAAPPRTRDLGTDAIYWSPNLATSVEQAVARARVLNRPLSRIPAASLYSDSRTEVIVERLDSLDWVVRQRDKRYQVLTDEQGCMVAATVPDYGVTIERRGSFPPSQYPVWTPYGAPPDGAYRALDVRIPAPGGHVLAGTLTVPPRRGKTPAVVLITGLSPHERNNGTPPWMPFRDIADALTRAGIAVLRVDDRGVGLSTGDRAPSTSYDEADDVRTEVAWLRARPDIDRKRIGLVGYSEGGLIAPMVAAGDSSIAGIVTLAGPGVPGSEVARYQVEQSVLLDPGIPDTAKAAAITSALADALKGLSRRESVYLTIDPLEYARRVRSPALIMQGGADATVPMRSAERLAAAMRGGGNRDVTVRVIPGVSHSLMPDPVGPPDGWAWLPAFLTSPVLLRALTQWTVEKLGASPR
jgi:dienelactone hydrolase